MLDSILFIWIIYLDIEIDSMRAVVSNWIISQHFVFNGFFFCWIWLISVYLSKWIKQKDSMKLIVIYQHRWTNKRRTYSNNALLFQSQFALAFFYWMNQEKLLIRDNSNPLIKWCWKIHFDLRTNMREYVNDFTRLNYSKHFIF